MFSFLGDVGGILGSVVSGGVTGLIGTALSGVFSIIKNGQQNKHELAVRHIDLEELRIETVSTEKTTALLADERKYVSDNQAQVASYREASSSWLAGFDITGWKLIPLVLGDFVRMMMRPVITLFSLWLLYRMLPADYMLQDGAMASQAVVYIAVTATLWYFGSRQIEKFSLKK